MPIRGPRSSRTCALFATPWAPTVLDPSSAALSAGPPPRQRDSLTRKYPNELTVVWHALICHRRQRWRTRPNICLRFIGEHFPEREANGRRRLWINTWSRQLTTLQVSKIGFDQSIGTLAQDWYLRQLMRISRFLCVSELEENRVLIDDGGISQQITYRYVYCIGNSMAFAGLANAKDRADVIAYLKSNSWEENKER